MRRLVIVGAGGFGREVVQIVAAINASAPTWDVVGFLDDSPSDGGTVQLALQGLTHLGGLAHLGDLDAATAAVIAIGEPSVRAAITAAHPHRAWATLVHPDTTLGGDVSLGAGTSIAAGTLMSTNVRVGRQVHVDHDVTVGHDSTLGDHVRLNLQACISDSAPLRERVLIGANATVPQGRLVDAWAVVGAGAVVVRDLTASVTVKGVPAR